MTIRNTVHHYRKTLHWIFAFYTLGRRLVNSSEIIAEYFGGHLVCIQKSITKFGLGAQNRTLKQLSTLLYIVLCWVCLKVDLWQVTMWRESRINGRRKGRSEMLLFMQIRAHLDYLTQPYDIGHMTVWSLIKNGLGPLKTKSPPKTSPLSPPYKPPSWFGLEGS